MPIPVEPEAPAPVELLDGRNRFPSTDDRLAYETHGPNLPFLSQAGKTVIIYSNAAGSVLADIVNDEGAAIAGSSLTVDNNSQIPQFYGPVGAEVLYARLNGGTAYPIYAWLTDRYNEYDAQFEALIDADTALDVRLDTLETYDLTVESRLDGHDAADAALDTRIDGIVTGTGFLTIEQAFASLVPASGDVTGVEDLANINAKLADGGRVSLGLNEDYYIAGSLNVTENGTLFEGNGSSLTQVDDETTCIIVTGDNCEVSGHNITGTSTGSGTLVLDTVPYGAGIALDRVNGCVVRNNKIADCGLPGIAREGAGIYLTGASSCVVENNVITGGAIGINEDSYFGISSNNTLRDNRLTTVSSGILLDFAGDNGPTSRGPLVTGNYVQASGPAGGVLGAGNGITVNATGADFGGARIIGNTVESCAHNGIIAVQGAMYTVINSNRVRACSVGIYVGTAGGPAPISTIVAENVISDCSSDGIQLESSSRTIIRGNTVTSCLRGLHSLINSFAQQTVVSGNQFYSNSEEGALLEDCLGFLVTGNQIHDNGTAAGNTYAGLEFRHLGGALASTGHIISSNLFDNGLAGTDTQKYGLLIGDQTGVQVSDNKFKAQSTAEISDASGGSATLLLPFTPTEWAPLTLQNSWVAAGGGNVAPEFRRDETGRVQVRGMIVGGTAAPGTIIATLPAGFRPTGIITFPVWSFDLAGGVQIDANGDLSVRVASSNWLALALAFDVT